MFPASKIKKFQFKKKNLYIYIYVAVESREALLDPSLFLDLCP